MNEKENRLGWLEYLVEKANKLIDNLTTRCEDCERKLKTTERDRRNLLNENERLMESNRILKEEVNKLKKELKSLKITNELIFENVEHMIKEIDELMANCTIKSPQIENSENYKTLVKTIKKIKPNFNPNATRKLLEYKRKFDRRV